ncbi:hypothetical protein C5G87_10560 [Paenibacillus peoriae]|uniref:hypothetical protein n=1 Tax=Paenibacillus peoriae TaxID=59893 RepID=UPI000CEC3DFA|nr:hypothetical protein [Paenibacillus peoriae]PPQ49026.1 hypothetical protein C5G87_10560 [Paenibacillus peoriae]
MAGTIIEQIIKEVVAGQIISKPESGPELIKLLRDLRNGKYTGVGPKKNTDITGNDVYFEWLEPIKLQTQNILVKESDQVRLVLVEADSVPLEVGYNSDHVYVFYNLDYEKDFGERIEKMYQV